MASVYTLAQIIAGEAQSGNDADSFGVASTIYNRTQNPAFADYGSDAISQATASGQFSAYPNALGVPTAYQLQLAQAAQNGTLSQYGDTGNATYYNAPGYAYQNNGSNAYGFGLGMFGKRAGFGEMLPSIPIPPPLRPRHAL
jgi:spore germination cell wall hydrolase CwlJ-like protein